MQRHAFATAGDEQILMAARWESQTLQGDSQAAPVAANPRR